MSGITAVRGEAVTFTADPFLHPEEECVRHYDDALIVISDGKIMDVSEYADIAPKYPGLSVVDRYEDALIVPGFVDCHAHYVQTSIVGSYGDTLLAWLNRYTFPEETRFSSPEYASLIAGRFLDRILLRGTTTANLFATTYAPSVDAIFEAARERGMRVISGKVLQDRNVPEALRDPSAEESVELSEELLLKWHGRGRQLYAVIPRFAPTSTPRQLELAGELYRKYKDAGVYMHSHLDEAEKEIRWVAELYPDCASYTDVYRRYGLTGERAVFAHCCVVRPEEWQTLHDSGCGVAHCPSSNLFLGGGQFKFWEAKDPERPVLTGMGTDIGGGTNFSVFGELSEAYKVGMIKAQPLSIIRSLYLATLGGAETLRLSDRTGRIEKGYDADLAVLDFKCNDFVEWRMQQCSNVWERLFALQTLHPSRAVAATYAAGRKYTREAHK
ncbi:MAG: guanine deaminase [Muribaculaceae bacterium]|nr:guanine deaminase [Muribaculaceae bacterium]